MTGRAAEDLIKNAKAIFLIACLLLACTAGIKTSYAQNIDNAATPEDMKLTPDDARRELKKVQDELDAALGKKTNVAKDLKNLSKERTQLNQLLIDTAKTISDGEAALTNLEDRTQELTERELLIRGSIAQRRDTISNLLIVMQRMGRQPPPVMTTHRDDALKMVRSAMLLASVFPPLKAQAERLTTELTELVTISADLQSKAAALKKENRELAKKRVRIKALLAAKKSRILSSQTSLRSIRQAAEKYKKNVENLGGLIKRLDKEVAEKAALGAYERELAKLEQDIKSGKVLAIAPEKRKVAMVAPGRIKPAISFGRAKGLLSLPVRGKRISKYGFIDALGRKSEGVTMETRAQAQVTAPCDGWIVYTGPFRSYGQLLIINAGGGYHVLLAGMGQINVSEGQFVVAGEPVAEMGGKQKKNASGKTKSFAEIYIEFRKKGRPIDPDPWWAETSEKAQG